MKNILEIKDLKKLAKKRVPKMFYDYVDSGSYSQSTYEENESDFKKIKLRIDYSYLIKNFINKIA